MIPIILRDLRWRIALLLVVAAALYALEPGFHQHDEFSLDAVGLGPLGISATLSYFAAIAMIVLLGGSLSTDRREGYSRLFFAHPTSPLGFYGLRWGVAYVISLTGALLFLVFGQVIAWGTMYGGWRGLLLPALSALVYGGLMAILSVVMTRGETWIAALLLFVPIFTPQLLAVMLGPLDPRLRQALLSILPPQGALARVWDSLLIGAPAWGAALFAAGYGILLLAAAVVILRLREWP